MLLTTLAIPAIHWRYKINLNTALNAAEAVGEAASLSVTASRGIAADIKRAFNALKSQAFNLERGRVNYEALRDSSVYEAYRQITRRLIDCDPTALSAAEQTAFWINLYNALTIHAVIAFGVRESVNEVPGFFWRAAYWVNRQRFSLHDIEQGVLRANAGHPLFLSCPQFLPGDARCRYCLPKRDPRLHFALVCAARSCPPIAVYNSEQLEAQLERAARNFVNNGGVDVDAANSEVRLSQIFQWYALDFGGPMLGLGNMQPVLRTIAQWVEDANTQGVLREGDLKVRYQPYDWALNV